MRLRSRIATILLTAAAWLAASASYAETLPEITAHSDRAFSVYQGDTVQLEVQVKASDHRLEAKWFKGNTVFCRALSCSIETAKWELGLHRLVFVVFNKAGSKFVRYNVRVVAAPEDHHAAVVHPDLIPASTVDEATNAYDLTVKSLHGRGYSYHQKKLQILGPAPRALDWTESLRTTKTGLLDFGRVGVESHTLAPGSAVRLIGSDEERRAIVLKRGTLRSRSLGSKDPRWSIVVPGLVQIDTDAQGDVLVSRSDFAASAGLAKAPSNAEAETDTEAKAAASAAEDEDKDDDKAAATPRANGDRPSADDPANAPVTITVLRGYARVFVRTHREHQGEDAGTAVMVGPGLSLTLHMDQDEDPGRPGLPELKATAALVAATSPQYLQGHWEEGLANGLAFTAVTPKTKSLSAAIAKAIELRADPVVVLELLLPKLEAAKNSYEAHLALGQAYQALYLYKAAETALKAAAGLRPEASEPLQSLGEMALLQQDWAAAERYLDSARDKAAGDSQRLDYELGVAAAFAKDGSTAAVAFDRALWTESGDPDIALSARAFRQRVSPSRWYDLRATGGLLYDSNILRSDSLVPASLGVGLTTKKGAGYSGALGFSLWPWRSPAFSTELAFDDGKVGYFTKSLNQLATIDQTLALRVSLGFGGGAGAQAFAVGLEVAARSIAIGGQGALDEIGERLTLSSPALAGLRLSVAPTNAVDPLPARVIVVDPLLREVVTPGDRSSRQLYYGLGLTPAPSDRWRSDLDLGYGSTAYKSSYEEAESFRVLDAKAHLDFTRSPRSVWSAGLAASKRSFAKSDDSRKDTLFEAVAGWRWFFVPTLSQTVELGYDKQTSSRKINSYKRQLFSYHLNWAL